MMETDFLTNGNHFLPLSQILFKESFIQISGNAFFSPNEWYCFLFSAFFPASKNHYYRKPYLKSLLLMLATIFFDFLDIPSMEAVSSSNSNLFLNLFSISASGNQLSV